MNVLETIIDEIMAHDKEHPDHGIGCFCHDKHAGTIRTLLRVKGMHVPDRQKSRANFLVILSYLQRHL